MAQGIGSIPLGSRVRDSHKHKKTPRSFSFKRKSQLYVLALFPFLFVLVFSYLPMGGIWMAFTDFNIRRGIFGSPFAGLRHFESLFTTPVFWDIFRNTVVLSVYQLVAGFPFPILMAIAFKEIQNKHFRKTIQTITFAPFFISTVVVVSILLQIFSLRFGLVNSFIGLFGVEPINWAGTVSFFRPAYVWSGVWQVTGFNSILFIAALSSVDTTLYEAASIDGANKMQRLRYIDLPAIRPTIVITLILSTGQIMSIGFEKVFLMQNPINFRVSEIIATFVFKVGIEQAQFSFATAVGFFNAVVNCALLLMVNWIARRTNETSLF